MKDEELGNISKKNVGRNHFGQVKMLDWNRIGNYIAILSLVLFWLWMSLFWILQYVPMHFMGAGSKANSLFYTINVLTPIADKVRSIISENLHALRNSLVNISLILSFTSITIAIQKFCPNGGYCYWHLPAIICFTIVALLVRRQNFRPRKPSFFSGDINFILCSYILIGIPLLIYFSFYVYKKWPSRKDDESVAQHVSDICASLANRIGYVALFCLTFFMIPATRHGPILAVLGWHPYHAITIHMWFGWACIGTSYIHMLLYILKYAVGTYSLQGWQYFFPPMMCFIPSQYYFEDADGKQQPPEGYEECEKALAGFFGTVAIFFLTILAICSMKFIRRNQYTVFYFAHIICAPMFLLFVVIHCTQGSYMFEILWPSLFYYFASQAPFLVQHLRWTVSNYGLKITDVMDIPCHKPQSSETEIDENHNDDTSTKAWMISSFSTPKPIDWVDQQVSCSGSTNALERCISISFQVSDDGFEQFYPGMYGNFWCPEAGMKSHPFSIVHVPGSQDQLRIIFRVNGKWTDQVARSFLQLPSYNQHQSTLPIPKIMMDGWHGPPSLVGNALNHDKVILIAAGIGITAYLSMLTEMIELLCFNKDGMFINMGNIEGIPQTKRIELHWTCRDENLIKYITDEYFLPLMQKALVKERESEFDHNDDDDDDGNNNNNSTKIYEGATCHIHIHRTGAAGAKDIDHNSLWKSFCDKTERKNNKLDFSSTLGVYGSAWTPYRFSFGRWSTFYQQIPSIIMFLSILLTSYALSWKVEYLLYAESTAETLPTAIVDVFQGLNFVPVLVLSFFFAYIGHVLMDWTSSRAAKKVGCTESSAKALNSQNSSEGEVEVEVDDSCILRTPVSLSSMDIINGTKLLTIDSTSGRPSFDKMLSEDNIDIENESCNAEDDDDLDDNIDIENESCRADDDATSTTGLFLRGFEAMMKSCKKASKGKKCAEDDDPEDNIDIENDSCNVDDDDATSTGSTADDDDDEDATSTTGLFLCGPAEMMKSCKKASKGKKCFVYEERFSW